LGQLKNCVYPEGPYSETLVILFKIFSRLLETGQSCHPNENKYSGGMSRFSFTANTSSEHDLLGPSPWV